MRIALFYHSLLSDWNHGNAHFLRGIAGELLSRGHSVRVYEPEGGWSLRHLLAEQGPTPLRLFRAQYPRLTSSPYHLESLDLDEVLDGVDLVIVHEWNDPELVCRVGEHRRRSRYILLFHDTHHRAASSPQAMADFRLEDFDGVLAFGEAVRQIYLRQGWGRRAWTWHEAADTRVFFPREGEAREGDLIWIGNWGDGERSAELNEFLLEPAKALGLRGRAFGVRYPPQALDDLARSGIDYGGWLANFEVPRFLARFALTLHIPRRPYVQALPGIPTIRVFEALACGIPLICSPWEDREGIFRPGRDYLLARNGREMESHLRRLLAEKETAAALVRHGLDAIRERHTCAHRVNELFEICRELGMWPK
ncbi:MAG: glycosyltransferase [Deltaproteobacteria bacterium]|nr:glycosyltransferase [Deltaproteobacteria bacterium]